MANMVKYKGQLYKRIDSSSLEHEYDEIDRLSEQAKAVTVELVIYAKRGSAHGSHTQGGNPKTLEEAHKNIHAEFKKLEGIVAKLKPLVAKIPPK